jgi:hypothetical protein
MEDSLMEVKTPQEIFKQVVATANKHIAGTMRLKLSRAATILVESG